MKPAILIPDPRLRTLTEATAGSGKYVPHGRDESSGWIRDDLLCLPGASRFPTGTLNPSSCLPIGYEGGPGHG